MSGYVPHTYQPDDNGRCQWPWVNSAGQPRKCNSTQRSSVMHDDLEAEFRSRHWHGGGDCMCFESEDGPSYYEAMRNYVEARS